MARLRVHNFTTSLDGYAAGPDQSEEHPLGVGGTRLHEWAFATRSFRQGLGMQGGSEGVDDAWKGWWGEDPPYHHPVFVLTHHPRDSVPMEGGTTFHFVTDGIEAARERAVEAADGRDVRIGGGAATIRQYFEADLIDVLHLAIVPILLGAGERLFDDPASDLPDRYECVEFVGSESVTHVLLERR